MIEKNTTKTEYVLTGKDAVLLARARNGELPCPRCGRPFRGEAAELPPTGDERRLGVRLFCACGFVEY